MINKILLPKILLLASAPIAISVVSCASEVTAKNEYVGKVHNIANTDIVVNDSIYADKKEVFVNKAPLSSSDVSLFENNVSNVIGNFKSEINGTNDKVLIFESAKKAVDLMVEESFKLFAHYISYAKELKNNSTFIEAIKDENAILINIQKVNLTTSENFVEYFDIYQNIEEYTSPYDWLVDEQREFNDSYKLIIKDRNHEAITMFAHKFCNLFLTNEDVTDMIELLAIEDATKENILSLLGWTPEKWLEKFTQLGVNDAFIFNFFQNIYGKII